MKKIIMIFLTLGLSAFGMSYQQFKKHTLENAKVLQSQALSLQATQEENKILLRTQNPTLNLEASQFDPDVGGSSFGYAFTASQNIRTGNYYEGLEAKANASTLLQQAYIKNGKAGYIKKLETLYTSYVYQSKLFSLLQQEYKLSNKVTGMVQERYTNGSENKVAYLQAKTDTLSLKTELYTKKQQMHSLYYQLLALSGLTTGLPLDKTFIYSVIPTKTQAVKEHPKQQVLHAKEKLIESQIHMNDSTINHYELYGEMESEPEQSILRIGVSIPIPVFNDRSEEKALAKLQMQQLSLDKEQFSIDLHAQKEILHASIRELSGQYNSLKTLKAEQTLLNDLLQEGYKIAQGSIFMMMSAKNKLIQTQKSLLQTQKMINLQKIELQFLQGAYND